MRIFVRVNKTWSYMQGYNRKNENGLTLPDDIGEFGHIQWWKDGKQHRDDKGKNGNLLPAIINTDGKHEWMIDGKRVELK